MEKQIISKIKLILMKSGLLDAEKLEHILGVIEPLSDVRCSVYALGFKLADYFVTQSVFPDRDMSKKITCCLDDIIFTTSGGRIGHLTAGHLVWPTSPLCPSLRQP
jgi:hypothetical protein